MSGQSTLQTYQRREPAGAPAPPFALNSAYNGLSVDTVTGQIVFGQDIGAVGNPAAFISNRELPMSFFDLTLYLNDSTDAIPSLHFNNDLVNPTGRIGSGQPSGDNGAFLNWQGGDPLGASPLMQQTAFTLNTVLTASLVNDEITTAEFISRYDDGVNGNQTGLLIDYFNQLFQMGDTNDIFNGNKLTIDDGIQEWAIGQRTAVTNVLINKPAVGFELAYFDGAGTNPFILATAASNGSSSISSSDFGTSLSLAHAAGGALANLGDLAALTTGMMISVDVPNNILAIQNTALNAVVQINGVNGFTGVVAPVNTITVIGGIVTNVA